MDATLWQSLLIFVQGCHDRDVLSDLCHKFLQQELRARNNEFAIYRFDAQVYTRS